MQQSELGPFGLRSRRFGLESLYSDLIFILFFISVLYMYLSASVSPATPPSERLDLAVGREKLDVASKISRKLQARPLRVKTTTKIELVLSQLERFCFISSSSSSFYLC